MREDDRAYFEDAEFKESLRRYESALSMGKSVYMDADELTDIAEYYMVNNKEKEANEAISIALDLHPGSVDPQVFLARQEMFHDRLDRAHEICDSIEDQNDREVAFLRAELMIREDEVEAAQEFLMDIHDGLDSGKADFLYDSACVFLDYDLFDEALVFATRLEGEHPRYSKTKPLLVDVLMAMENYEAAIPIINDLLDSDPYDTECWLCLAESQYAQGKWDEAMESAEFVLAITPDDRKAVVVKAKCLMETNTYDKAHDTLHAYLTRHPADSLVLYHDSVCLSFLERYDEALASIEKSLSGRYNDADDRLRAYLQLAYIQSKRRNAQKALAALDKASGMESDNISCDFDLLRGEIYLENGYPEHAVTFFIDSLKRTSDREVTMFNICVAYLESGYCHDASDLFSRYMDEYPDSARKCWPYLALSYYQSGETEQYLKYLKMAAEDNPDVTQFLFSKYFPSTPVEEYYTYAYRAAHGVCPPDGGRTDTENGRIAAGRTK